jgi:hypothetical protein
MSSYQSNDSTCRFLMVELARCYKGAGEMPIVMFTSLFGSWKVGLELYN